MRRRPHTHWRLALALSLLTLPVLATGCTGGRPEEDRPLRALTGDEYNQTIADLYGYSHQDAWPEPEFLSEEEEHELGELWPWTFPDEAGVDGFEGFSAGQNISPYLIEQYEAAAAHFAPFALAAPRFQVCEGALQDCAWESVDRFAHRAFRRPLDEGEATRLRAFFDANVSQWGTSDGVVLTVQGILQAPQFLYLLEVLPPSTGEAQAVPLTSWEMASRLSYFLWDSMPDAALFEAAARDQLQTAEQVRSHARRMLQDPRAREAVVRFHHQWLGIEEVYKNRADLMTYAPTYIPHLLAVAEEEGEGLQEVEEFWSGALIGMRRGMEHEADLFIEKTIFEGGGRLADLLTDNHGYFTEVMAFDDESPDASTGDLYGVTASDVLDAESYEYHFDDGNLGYVLNVRPATFPADQRSGVLTLGAVLAGRAHPVHPAPVLRGTFVLERLLCEAIGQPPDEAAGQAPPDSITAESTNRERVDATTAPANCNVCHERINPAGFAFENYDSMGGYRTEDNGQPVDASGTFLTARGTPLSFTNAVELGQALASSDEAHDCYSAWWLRYALGRLESHRENAQVQQIQQGFRNADRGDVRALLVRIAGSDLFRFRATSNAGGAQ